MFGYYDGPTEGIIEFANSDVYCFKVLAMDLAQEVRALTLARIRGEDFEGILRQLVASLGTPRWPMWVPMWNFTNAAERSAVEMLIDVVCANAVTIAAAICDDALERCFAVKPLDDATVANVTDWFAFINA